MKYVKILGLLAVAAAALMAFAGSAFATTITAPTGTAYTGAITATSEGTAKLKNPIATIECHSQVKGEKLTHGNGVTAEGAITSLLWGKEGTLNGKCHNSWEVGTVNPGTLQIHYLEKNVGTLTSSGAKVLATRFGIKCVYETNNTDIGKFTDSHKTGATATLHIEATIPINEAESSGLCFGIPAEWSGSYKVETPDAIYIDQ